MMTCLETQAATPEYLAGALSRLEREELLQHLTICRGCAHRVVALRRVTLTIRQSVAGASDPSPGEVPESLLWAIMSVIGSEPFGAPDWQRV